jgi:carbonic anhydrase
MPNPNEVALTTIKEHFPRSNINSELLPLVFGNQVWLQWRASSFEPQLPRYVVDNCGKLAAEVVHNEHNLGRLFDVSSRGLRSPDEHLESIAYAFKNLNGPSGKPSATVLEVLAHRCIHEPSCRRPDYRPGNRASIDPSWSEGLRILPVPGSSELPQSDLLHARATSAQILSYSKEIHKLIAAGDLLLAEAFYDNASGRIHYTSFIGSQTAHLPEKVLMEIARGEKIQDPNSLQPALKDLHSLVTGNAVHVATFKPAVPTEFIIFGCADSRTSPYIIFQAPHGLIEIVRNAGNSVNPSIIDSFAISVEEALSKKKQLGLKEKVHIVVLTHTRCGAVTATLSQPPSRQSAPDSCSCSPIVDNLQHRFEHYRQMHPNFRKTDERLVEASECNAVEAVLDIYHAPGESAKYLRSMIREGKLTIVPARYLLKSGRVEFFDSPPLRAETGAGFDLSLLSSNGKALRSVLGRQGVSV